MEAVGPVVRVKLYRDAEGNAKGDALVTYQKDAAVLGAIQLLNGRELRPGQRAGQRWPVDISRPVWNGGAVGAPADRPVIRGHQRSSDVISISMTSDDRPAGPASTTWSSTSVAAPLEVAAPALVDLRGAAAAPATAASSIAAPPRLIPGLTRIPGLCEYQAMLSARAQPGKTVAAGAKRSAAASAATTGGSSSSAAVAAAPSRLAHPSDVPTTAPTDGDMLRVVVVRRLFLPSEVPSASAVDARRVWAARMVDELWEEACKYGEVERIEPLLDGDALSSAEGCAAIRFQSVLSAAAAVDALDGRFFCERALSVAFDDGRAARVLPAGEDVRRQQRFGFGEMAQAYQESMRVLRLASAEGAPFIGCAAFVAELEHYQYAAAGAHGAGYYRHEGAPPPDPYEQASVVNCLLIASSECL